MYRYAQQKPRVMLATSMNETTKSSQEPQQSTSNYTTVEMMALFVEGKGSNLKRNRRYEEEENIKKKKKEKKKKKKKRTFAKLLFDADFVVSDRDGS